MSHVRITQPETERRRKALQAKLKELLSGSAVREDLQIEYLADPLDQVVSEANREIALRSVDQKTRLVHEVQLALEAIAGGSYGICEACEREIPRRRLEALPWARLCVACQSAEEAAGHVDGEVPVFTFAA